MAAALDPSDRRQGLARPAPSCSTPPSGSCCEEGYAAVTSRRVAAEAGLKPQLVHYYFRTMDDLFIEVFRRRAEENLDRFERAIAEDGSLAEPLAAQRRSPRCAGSRSSSWRWPTTARRSGPRSPATPSASGPPRSRPSTERSPTRGVDEDQLPPIVALLLMTGLSQVLALEGALGVTAGHEATLAYVERAICDLDDGA